MRQKSYSIAEKLAQNFAPVSSEACKICYEDKPNSDFFFGLGEGCNHKFCFECTRGQLKVNISESKVMKIKCFEPDCGIIFEDKDIKAVLQGLGEEGD